MTGIKTSAEVQAMDRAALVRYALEAGCVAREEQARALELKAALEQQKALEKTNDLFLSLVFQELRAPISVISGYVGLIDEVLRASDAADDLRDFLRAITKSGERLESLVQDLLDFSKTRTGSGGFEKKDVHIPAMLQLLAQELVVQVREKSQQLKIELKSDFRPIKADGERLREAIVHLVRNAVRHTPVGGTIRVACEDEGLWVCVRVSDEGPGVPEDEREKIFAPFYLAANGSASVGPRDGLGLGLSIARHAVESHGGSIHVEGGEGRGAVFTVRLPRAYEDTREMVAEFQSRFPGRVAGLARNLQTAENQVLAYAQELSSRLSEERLRVRQLEESLAEMEQTYLETIAALANATDAKDAYNLGHTERVTWYARCIARELSPALLDQREFKYSLLLHDLGKIGIAEELLKKAGRLSESEWETVKSHSEIGARLLSSVRFLAPALASVRSHHERYDGKGYPDGLRGEQIPLPARIIAVADAFEALTSDRPYRAGVPLEVARDEIAANGGTQFDPEVVDAFLRGWSSITAFARSAQ